jgi:hypothetical protein
MHANELGDCARPLLLQRNELCTIDVVLLTKKTGELRLRVFARPENHSPNSWRVLAWI